MARPDRTVSAVRAVAPLAAPLGAVALALFLLGRLVDTRASGNQGSASPVTSILSSALAPGQAAPAPAPVPAAVSVLAPSAQSAALAIDALALGRYAQVRGATGLWPRRGLVER